MGIQGKNVWYLRILTRSNEPCIVYGTEENLRAVYDQYKGLLADGVDGEFGTKSVEVHGFANNCVRTETSLVLKMTEITGMFLADYW